MADINTKAIRNIVLLGHGGSGKTTVAEAALYLSKSTDRFGKVTDGNTVCDYDPEEIKRGFTLNLSVASMMWKDIKINLIDTPGFLDFSGDVYAGIRVADAAIITLDGKAGVEVGTELAWNKATGAGIPRAFFINKCDDPDSDFERVYKQVHYQFGNTVCPVLVPYKQGRETLFLNLIEMKAYSFDAKGVRSEAPMTEEMIAVAETYKEHLNEALAATSEELMEKYFEGEEITREEAIEALHQGIIDGSIVPIFCGSAAYFWGITFLLDTIANSFPRPTARRVLKVIEGDSWIDVPIEVDGECTLLVFKTIADPFGKQTYFRVMSGTLTNDMVLKNQRSGASEKMSHFYTVRGKKQTEVTSLCCGDIGMITKLSDTNTNDTLTVSSEVQYKKIAFPHAYMTMAIKPAAKGDEDKISTGITRLIEEDPTLVYENNPETKQMTISGLGDMQLDVVVSKLKSRYSTTVVLEKPKLAYRETIKGSSDVEGKHKKQSGGSGQYGHVKMRFSHSDEFDGLEFVTSVVGGTVPKNFFPAVEKGLQEAMVKGVLAGYPVVNLKADLYDGSYHPVDSNEISFKLAAKLAYKEGLPKAKPILLEPIGSLKVSVPDALVGDVIGDLNKRRGRVLGMNPDETKQGYTIVEADAPKAEMMDYVISLRAMSQGRGEFEFVVDRYEEVPSSVAQKVIADAKVDEE